MKLLERWYLVLGVLAAVFFVLYASFYARMEGFMPSPDERANQVFFQTYLEQGTFKRDRPVADERVLARSVNIRDGYDVPGFFLGLLIILVSAGKILGAKAALFVPAAMAAAAPIALYAILRRIFPEYVARLSSLWMFILPSWFYYSSRSLLPNAPMLAAWLGAAALLLAAHDQWVSSQAARGRVFASALAIAAGLLAGAALAIRPVEALWILPITICLLAVYRKEVSWSVLTTAFCSTLFPLIIAAVWQQATYGHWYLTGYSSFASASGAAAMVEGGVQTAMAKVLFPFGLHPWEALVRFWQQSFAIYWWAFILLVVGFFTFYKAPEKSREQKLYSMVFCWVFGYLVLYYGAWSFQDHPDPNWVSIGVAYHRYWLPISVLMLPFLVLGFRSVTSFLPALLRPFLWTGISALCLYTALASGDDALGRLGSLGVNYEEIATQVASITPENAVIASERNDKVFWPQRAVYQVQGNDVAPLAELAQSIDEPVYLVTAIPESHIRVIEQTTFVERGFMFESVGQAAGYTIYVINEQP